jgi:putative membrane protein
MRRLADDVTGQVDPDSRTRTHLANERTFLAWFRTGLTLIALGIAAAQFLAVDAASAIPATELLASLLVLTGVALVTVGAYRYLGGRDRIDAAAFRPAGWSIIAAAVVAGLIGALAIALVWARPS